MSKFKINLHEAIYSLSDALDLVSIEQAYHGKRVAFVAESFGMALNWDVDRLNDLFLSALLHDCGVSNTAIHIKLTRFESNNLGNHCVKGARLLKKTPLLASLSDNILHHHTAWTELVGLDLPDAVKIVTNCIFLADRVDVLTINYLDINPNILVSKETIRKKIKEKRNLWFKPELVDIFLKISEPEAFWLALIKVQNAGYINSCCAQHAMEEIDFQDLKQVVLIFSDIIDAKSYFTVNHSEGVANLSRYLGELFKLSEHTCDKLELAGLLHDLGKLRVPDKILEKPGLLTESEYQVVQQHSFDTCDILKTIKGFEDIATWAGLHHERVDGSGYPFRSNGLTLALEARIIAVADVFQALTQKRPYRDKFSKEETLLILKEEMTQGRLDKDVVLMLENNINACWNVANCLD